MNRRTLIAGLGIGGLASLSGCLGVIGMDEHEAAPAGVAADVRDDTGYERTNVEELVIEETVGTDSVSEEIVVRNYLTELEKAVDMGPLGSQRGAVFSVLATPQVGVAGQQFNPVEDMSAQELVDLLEDNYDEIENVSFEDEDAITMLEQATMRSRFTAEAEFDGTSVDVDVHVSEAVEAGDDLVVTIGVYPSELRSREGDNVVALMEGVLEALEGDFDEDADDEGADDEDTDDEGADDEDTDDEGADDGDGTDDTDDDGSESDDTGGGDEEENEDDENENGDGTDDGDENSDDDGGILG